MENTAFGDPPRMPLTFHWLHVLCIVKHGPKYSFVPSQHTFDMTAWRLLPTLSHGWAAFWLFRPQTTVGLPVKQQTLGALESESII